MSAHILNGKELASKIKTKLKKQVLHLKEKGITPVLAVIRIGDNPASKIYVASKCRQSEEVGIQANEHHLDPSISRSEVLELIYRLNNDPATHGILIQLPLPKHLDHFELIAAIDPKKDVDGLHPYNQGLLATGQPGIVPCTPKGCLALLKDYKKSLDGLNAAIIGRSILVGRPMGMLLLQENCTVTYTHSHTASIEQKTREADILIVAVGVPKLITKSWIKPGAIVIDVGINYLIHDDGSSDLVGDVDYHVAKEIASAITPVPGGVGPMTVVSLLQNTIEIASKAS
ncbi:MAG: bifunctional methylenetetrahydrofolate dehydrogenase/methenyltetrahydrofolate cyclohydrolase FolD [Candidatus Nucleicultricaceae bacterium]